MGILSGNPEEEPMHYGEIYTIWQFSMMAKGALSCNQAYQNHAGDKQLKQMLEDIAQQAALEIKECDALLLENGIAPAPTLPERPKEKSEDIPVGARFTDPEIGALIAADTAIGLVACSQAIGQCLREDVAALFIKYHATKLAFGARILRINKEKGWLIPPPLQLKTPELVEA